MSDTQNFKAIRRLLQELALSEAGLVVDEETGVFTLALLERHIAAVAGTLGVKWTWLYEQAQEGRPDGEKVA